MLQERTSNRIGEPFIILKAVESSNNYAMGRIHAQVAHHGTVYFAKLQTAGKGQRGRTWEAEAGSSILMSIVIDPMKLTSSEAFQLSAMLAVTVCEWFAKYSGTAHIKWPNDLYWQDRKAGGILVENIVSSDNWKWAIAGIGININQQQFSESLPNPVSLLQITGKSNDPVQLALELCREIETNFLQLQHGDFSDILARYNRLLYNKNQVTKFRIDNRVFEATVKSVNPNGLLVVKHAFEEELEFGSVQWIM